MHRDPPDPADEADLFRRAVADARPLQPSGRVHHDPPRPWPIPRSRLADDAAVLDESLHGPLSLEDRLEGGDEPSFLRAGLPRQALRDLRRGRWVIQAEIDLHGATRDEARGMVAGFLGDALRDGLRCVRVVHGKGMRSPGRVSVLRQAVRGWLTQRQEVLAYCQAKPQDGGEGALIVLLRASCSPR